MGNINGRLIAARSFAGATLVSLCVFPFGHLHARSSTKSTAQDFATAASIGKIAFASDRDGNLEIRDSSDGLGVTSPKMKPRYLLGVQHE